jgi:S1-C subfamily serine protease
LAHDNTCGSFECAPASRPLDPHAAPVLSVSVAEVEAVRPQLARRPIAYNAMPMEPAGPRRFKKLAVLSLVLAILGIPLFGIVTGLVAIILGSIALGSINSSRERGTACAVLGILIGLVEMVGWCVFLAIFLMHLGPGAVDIGDFESEPTNLENLAPHVRGPMIGNVLISSLLGQGAFAQGAIGSGVIIQIENNTGLIVTNRHVVDPDYTGNDGDPSPKLPEEGRLQVKIIGLLPQPGKVVWMAPDGIDLALLTVNIDSQEAKAVTWRRKMPLMAGEDVFTIGNPQHLDWSITRGTISQFRLMSRAARKIRLIQTDAALNPGNSGGGLYDKDGVLIGINTLASDKRFAEGINFAITFDTLLSLHPPFLHQAEDSKVEAEAK